jgi:tetratricopeptide (TPR) repeat protein
MSLLLEALKTAALKKQQREKEAAEQAAATNPEPVSQSAVEENSEGVNSTEELSLDEIFTTITPEDGPSETSQSEKSTQMEEDPYIEIDMEIDPDVFDEFDTVDSELGLDEAEIEILQTESVELSSEQELHENLSNGEDVENNLSSKQNPTDNLGGASHLVESHQPEKSHQPEENHQPSNNTQPIDEEAKKAEQLAQVKKSRDALNELVHQQNTQYKKKRLINILSLLLAALIIVLLSGYFFYSEILEGQLTNSLYTPQPYASELSNPSASELSTSAKQIQANTEQVPETLPANSDPVSETIAQTEPVQQAKTSGNSSNVKKSSSESKIIKTDSNLKKALVSVAAPVAQSQSHHQPGKQQGQNNSSHVNHNTKINPQKNPQASDDKGNGHNVETVPTKSNILKISRRKISNKTLVFTQEAYQYYQKGDYFNAEQFYQLALSKKANYSDALLGLAAIAIKQNNISLAKDYYRQVLRTDPNNSTAILTLNQLKQAIFPQKAEQFLKNELQSDPENARLQASSGNFYASQERWKQAQQHYFKAYTLDRNNIFYCFNLAVSLDHLGKSQQAINYYNEALLLSQNNKQGNFHIQEMIVKRLNVLSQTERLY